MTDKKEIEIVVMPEAQAQLDADPELKAAVTDIFAAMRQASHAVQTGQYKSFEDAMEAITGQRPEAMYDDEA